MNSSFYLSGLIALTLYLFAAALILGYFHYYSKSTTVGTQDSITIDLQTLSIPEKTDNKPHQQAKQPPRPKPQKQSQQPKAAASSSIQELFAKVQTKKSAPQAQPRQRYSSSYTKQRFSQREPASVNIDSIKNVTITQQQMQGDVKDEAIMAFQRFIAKNWNPDTTRAYSAKLAVTVAENGELVYRVLLYSNNAHFNRQVDAFIQNVDFYKPVDKRMRIELVLKTTK